MKLHIDSMTCGGCARGVTAAIKELDPAAVVEIDVASKQVQVQSAQPAQRIIAALEQAGFPPQPIDS